MPVISLQLRYWLLWVAVLVFSLLFFVKAVLIHQSFGTSAFDFGIHIQNLVLLQNPLDAFNTVRGLPAWGDHFHPIQYLFVPLYAIYPTDLWLLLVQGTAVAWAAIILFRFTDRQLPDFPWVAPTVALTFLINPVVHNPLVWHFHPIVLALPLLLLLVQAYLERRDLVFLVALVLVLLVREDVWPATFILGLIALGQRRWRIGIAALFISLAWWFFVSSVAMPFFNGEGYFRDTQGPLASIVNNLFNPDFYLERLWEDKQTLEYLGFLFLPLLMLPLASPVWVLPAIPTILIISLIGGYQTDITYHYSVYSISFLYMAAIVTLRKWVPRRPATAPLFMVGLVAASVLAASLGSRAGLQYLPRDLEAWKRLEGMRGTLAAQYVEVEPDAGIASTDYLLPHMAQRRSIYLFPNPWKNHYWGIGGERPHHPNTVDYLFLRPSDEQNHYRLLRYLVDRGYFESRYSDSQLWILERVKREPEDRDEAVSAARDYVFADADGVSFGVTRISPVRNPPYEPLGGFEFVRADDGPPSDWKVFAAGGEDLLLVDFEKLSPALPSGAYDLYAPIVAETDGRVSLLVGSDDTLEVWFNGRQVMNSDVPRMATLGDNRARLDLMAGVNHLYFRVGNFGGAWKLIAALARN